MNNESNPVFNERIEEIESQLSDKKNSLRVLEDKREANRQEYDALTKMFLRKESEIEKLEGARDLLKYPDKMD